MKIKSLLKKNKGNLALVVGNGVNRYRDAHKTNSWEALLLTLARRHRLAVDSSIPKGIVLTEFYDLLELKSGPSTSTRSLQQDFCTLMQGWQPHDHHKRIVYWAEENDAPILTTNFDNLLARAGGYELLPKRTKKGFTDYYPWERYYGNSAVESPAPAFGIWHINGMQKYRRSIRLGLTHYMGSAERARSWLYKGEENRLFSGKSVRNWRGVDTWLHLVFHKPLLIFGLALEENEVFLRWLLIERARYFRKFRKRHQPAWFVYTSKKESEGKLYFLEGIGIHPIQAANYEELYSAGTWG